MRVAYLSAGIIVAILQLANYPRIFWIHTTGAGPVGIFRGFVDGMIGFSYMTSWALIIAGVYCLLLGVLYWDMDTAEHKRWQFTLEGLGTARLLWVIGALGIVLGGMYAVWTYSHDMKVWPAGIASTLVALLVCWLFWLAFPLYEQVGIDRDEIKL